MRSLKNFRKRKFLFALKENHWVEIKSGKSTFNIMGISGRILSFLAFL